MEGSRLDRDSVRLTKESPTGWAYLTLTLEDKRLGSRSRSSSLSSFTPGKLITRLYACIINDSRPIPLLFPSLIDMAVERRSSERSRRRSLLSPLWRPRESARVRVRSRLSPRCVRVRSTLRNRRSRLSLRSRMTDLRISIAAIFEGLPLSPRETVRDFSCPPNIEAAEATLKVKNFRLAHNKIMIGLTIVEKNESSPSGGCFRALASSKFFLFTPS